MNSEIDLLQRRIERERAARHEAEAILEQKALELYLVNSQLRSLNEGLEQEIKERTSALLIEQTRLYSLITNLDSGVLLEDENRRIVLVNQMFCQLFDIHASPQQLKGMDCTASAMQSMHLFSDPAGFVTRIDELLARHEICSQEILYLADGRVFNRTFIPIFSNEKYLGHLWKYRDVTSIHHATQDLRHSEEKYRGIIENMELGLMEVDNDGLIMRAYPPFCEMVGYQEAELVGKEAMDIFLVPEFLPVFKKQSDDRAQGKAGVYEIQIFRKDGEKIWVLISGAPIYGPEDRIIGTLGIHYNITKQKNLQRDLEAARHSAEAAQEAEKQFLANMSHEIRTPLNAIIGMSHLLYDTQPTNEQLEYLDILRNSAEMLRALISDVLDLSKIRAGHLEVQEREIDLVGMVRSLVKSAQIRLEGSPVSVEADIDPRIRSFIIGDDLLLHQILSNLMGNAEKFTERGKILVTVREVTDATINAGNAYEIRVADTGIGIYPEKFDLIFQTFRQVDGDIKRKFGGTGLGLAITRQIVELQGGTIRVESEIGRGSTFIVRLPYRVSSRPIRSANKEEVNFSPVQTKGKRLLVVEDNYMNRKYVGALLLKWGVSITFANNGREGVERARQEPFDLILMDIQMPEMDGYEASIAIRQSANPNTRTPIIALTASALVSQKDKAFAAGMDDYLSKPFKPAQLFEKVSLFCSDSVVPTAPATDDGDDAGFFRFNPRLDAPSLHNLYGDDLDYAREMFDTFLHNVLPEFDRLQPLLESGNYADFARILHKLKPTFAMVGLPDIERQMQAFEIAAKSTAPDPLHLRDLFNKLEADIPEGVSAVRSDLEKLTHLS